MTAFLERVWKASRWPLSDVLVGILAIIVGLYLVTEARSVGHLFSYMLISVGVGAIVGGVRRRRVSGSWQRRVGFWDRL
jgi:uncharacterized membrane protein HdeD (DUF308 family)